MDDREFEQLLEKHMQNKREWMRESYDRVLPSGELIFNRFDKSEYLGFGKGSSCYDTSVIMGDVKAGDHVWIGPYTLIEGANAPVEIGDYVTINAGAMIYSHDSTKYYVSGGKNPVAAGPVKIGSCTVIGTMSIICCGVTIGSHCVVASNSLVNIDVPDWSIVGGNPARIIGRVIEKENGEVEFDYGSK